MFPILRNGARVEVQPVVYDELEPGDLIVFTGAEGLICHRLIRKSTRILTLKGDTNLWMDPPVALSQVVGRVTRLVSASPDEWRIHLMDSTPYKRRARLLARFTYLYAFYFTTLHFLGSCRWWTRGIEFVD